MVEARGPQRLSIDDLEHKTELELEHLISANSKSNPDYANDCRYVLGRLQVDGIFPRNVSLNMQKGLNWIKEAAKAGHKDADEFKTYQDIRFEKVPNIKKIEGSLMQAAARGSTRAINTLGEFAHA